MTQRTSRTSVTFTHSSFLAGLDVLQPAGTYRIETVDVELDNVSLLAYRRASRRSSCLPLAPPVCKGNS